MHLLYPVPYGLEVFYRGISEITTRKVETAVTLKVAEEAMLEQQERLGEELVNMTAAQSSLERKWRERGSVNLRHRFASTWFQISKVYEQTCDNKEVQFRVQWKSLGTPWPPLKPEKHFVFEDYRLH